MAQSLCRITIGRPNYIHPYVDQLTKFCFFIPSRSFFFVDFSEMCFTLIYAFIYISDVSIVSCIVVQCWILFSNVLHSTKSTYQTHWDVWQFIDLGIIITINRYFIYEFMHVMRSIIFFFYVFSSSSNIYIDYFLVQN